jgi:hypothetical protein
MLHLLTFYRWQCVQIYQWQRKRGSGDAMLYWLVMDYGKVCTQTFVAADNFAEAFFKSGTIKQACEPNRTSNVVGGSARMQLFRYP